MVQLPNQKTIHQLEADAIEYLEDEAASLDPQSDDVSVIKVSVENEDWTIAEMSWQNIAIRLMDE